MASSHKTNYIKKISETLNIKGHQNCCIGSKATAILLNGWILPTGRWKIYQLVHHTGIFFYKYVHVCHVLPGCTVHYVFRSMVALHSFRLKLCSVKYIVQFGNGSLSTKREFVWHFLLGRFSHRVAMPVCLCHLCSFFLRPLIGPEVT